MKWGGTNKEGPLEDATWDTDGIPTTIAIAHGVRFAVAAATIAAVGEIEYRRFRIVQMQ